MIFIMMFTVRKMNNNFTVLVHVHVCIASYKFKQIMNISKIIMKVDLAKPSGMYKQYQPC